MIKPAGAGFVLDEFQRRAIEHLEAGRSVLVTAPTGSGKTVVADHAVDRTLAAGRRAFYTTPIKALSNQKYRDLRRRLGSQRVGLLTGDNVIAGDADVVVMTTEVLRNMLYAEAVDDRLGAVVLDEVHYLEDPYRGPVWEEVILHLPSSVVLVCLSATVSNHEQLGGWLEQVSGPTAVVVESRRPVPLTNLYAVGRRRSDAVELIPTLVDGKPNPKGGRFDLPAAPRGSRGAGGSRRGGPRGAGGSRRGGPRRSGSPEHRGHRPRAPWRPPRRVALLGELAERGLLPVIWFVFSRKGCDQAAARLARDGVRCTDDAEADRVDELVEARLGRLDPADLAALDARRWAARLRLGIAPHHAGMVPVFKEIVEQCFAEGLAKVVFATETLALGVNMPARSVVIDKPVKYDGQSTVPLRPAQYTQFTGRAGRRGIDEAGWAVALWSPDCTFGEMAEMASSRSFELRSAFRPTYNMVAGLLARMPAEEARNLMARSFAQHQADAASSKSSLPRQFDAVASVLRERGHLDGWTLTASGWLVSRIFHEADLAVAEALHNGQLDGLSAPELASVLSAFTYEHRSPGPRPEVWVPSGTAYRRLRRLGADLDDLHRTEQRCGASPTRSLEIGFAPAAHRWAAGESFDALLEEGFAAGDFVRNVKQLADLARQIAAVSPSPGTARAARRAVEALNRGVVALSGAVEVDD
jgi:ATP-dependent RNA helicase HelY